MNRHKKPTEEPPITGIKQRACTAFVGHACVASGDLVKVARAVKKHADRGSHAPLLVFDDATGEAVELDLRGTPEEVVERIAAGERAGTSSVQAAQKRGPGRPKLGVLAREVTLLPGQWDWLDEQPGGASAALRRLVYEAKVSSQGKNAACQAQEAVYRVMTTLAGNLPGYEEVLRAFYRREQSRFNSLTEAWPSDVRRYLKRLVTAANKLQRIQPTT